MPKRYQSRNFSLVTYLDLPHLTSVFSTHWEKIDWYAFIYHDKDKTYPLDEYDEVKNPFKPVHCHIVLRTKNPLTCKTVRNWFYDSTYVDHNDKQINTLCQLCTNPVGASRYLMHMDDPHKQPYQLDQVVTNNPDFETFITEDYVSEDSMLLCLLDINRGMSFTNLCYRYGTNFIIHQARLYESARLMRQEEFGVHIQNNSIEEFNEENEEFWNFEELVDID